MLLIFYLLLLVFLIGLSAFFSSSETVLYLVNNRIESSRHLKLIQTIKQNEEEILTNILVSNTLINIFIGIIFEKFNSKFIFTDHSLIYSIILTTTILLFFGEILPKRFAIVFYKILYPAYYLILLELKKRLKYFYLFFNLFISPIKKIEKEENYLTIDEIKTALVDGYKNKYLDEVPVNLLLNLLELSRFKAKDIMVPYTRIRHLKIDDSFDRVIECFKYNKMFKIPVLNIDDTSIIGYIDFRELSDFIIGVKSKNEFNLKDFVKLDAKFAYIDEKLISVLDDMKETGEDYVFVIDQYFQFKGVISFYNLIPEGFRLDRLEKNLKYLT